MSEIPFIRARDAAHLMSWPALCDAMEQAHRGARAEIRDTLLARGGDRVLSRAAWIDGLGFGVKTASVFPENPSVGRPTIQGAMLLFDDATGAPVALIENALITRWKTAADSVLGARLLARQDARRLLIIGAGAVAESLIEAYPAVLSQIEQISVWNRSTARADALGAQYDITVETDLEAAVAAADIVVTATLSETPVLSGTLLQAGQHLDLIGAFTPTMREVDDVALTRARIFVDARETTLDHIGELLIPLKAGVITPEDIQGDLHDLATAREGRRTPEEITLYKNGGGGHLDLITARYILSVIATEV